VGGNNENQEAYQGCTTKEFNKRYICNLEDDELAEQEMKLSETQQHVIDRMKSGWQLGTSTSLHPYSWLQKDGCGRGGESEDVHAGTVSALYNRGAIVVDVEGFPLRTYKLVEGEK